MYQRGLSGSKYSFFLFGPRGTGKSTWVQSTFPDAMLINLLHAREHRALLKDPGLLADWIKGSEAKTIVIDEVQKLPELLDEVQSLMTSDPKRQFVLLGSSARKLKKLNSNLLAGRARSGEMFTLTSSELNFDFDIHQVLKFGTLPAVIGLSSDEDKIEFLEAYVQTYLNEEIKQEAIVRDLEPFVRFLEVSAILNGQIWNNSEISREVGAARTTIEGYLSVLMDTLIGIRIEGLRAHAKVKERQNPKYYYFDCGVIRALGNNLRRPPESFEVGFLFETFILNELRAYSSYHKKSLKISYWGTPSTTEVDFVVESNKERYGIEVKMSKVWKTDFNYGLKTLLESKKIKAAYGVFNGERVQKSDLCTAFPVKTFLKRLWANELF